MKRKSKTHDHDFVHLRFELLDLFGLRVDLFERFLNRPVDG